jgi:hypothetical protein
MTQCHTGHPLQVLLLFRGLRLKAGCDMGHAIADIQRTTGEPPVCFDALALLTFKTSSQLGLQGRSTTAAKS